jgi:hypothetical protein
MPIITDDGQLLPQRSSPTSVITQTPRRASKAALDGFHDGMNDALHGALRSTPETMAHTGTPKSYREQKRSEQAEEEALNERAAQLGMSGVPRATLDQGARGPVPGAPVIENDGSGNLRQALREAREGRGE